MAKPTALQNLYNGMKQKCVNPNNPSYFKFGAVGITVCEEWVNNYSEFYLWMMSNGWKVGNKPKLYLERHDFNKGFNPDNCFISKKSLFRAARNREVQLKLWKDPVYKKMMSEMRLALFATPEWKEAKSKGQLKAFSNRKVLERMSRSCKRAWKTRSKEPWNTDIFKRMMSCLNKEAHMIKTQEQKNKSIKKQKRTRAIENKKTRRINNYSGVITREQLDSL